MPINDPVAPLQRGRILLSGPVSANDRKRVPASEPGSILPRILFRIPTIR
ncbi:hypothetical protein ACNJYD_05530 [Bradyrhizobium sp. DASA03005]|nr:hypothetical protein [Bradyrhizobium liaoningense]MBR1165430.1 hypothetical protein [Bradyrhizobium liaoningense]